MATALKLERTRQNIKQYRLASLIGISPSELSLYESGRQRCPADMRYKISNVLGVKVDELFPEEANQ